ncbi:MAG: acyl--CoA ligase [Spirochaetaceae bacterium]|nr:acyl--CoA ligase [Spirochaetaceae bacterium]
MSTLQPIYDQLTAAGSPFELREEEVLGVRMPVFAARPRSLRELLVASAAHDDREFLVCGSRRRTYREHRERVGALARGLAERYAIGRGDRVAILAANGPEWIETFWAVTSLGGIVVAMNGWWVGDEIEHAIGDSDPKLIVVDRKRLARLPDSTRRRAIVEIESDFEALVGTPHPLAGVEIDEDDPACILYTSGTTGRAKGAVLSHRAFLASVALQTLNGAAMRIASGAPMPSSPPCTLLTTPLFHVSGLVAGVVMMLSVGAKVVLREGRFDPVDVMRLIDEEGVTSWSTTPTMVHRVVHHPEVDVYRLTSLANLGSGGSALSPELQEKIRKRLPQAGIGLGYGLTESGGIATINSGSDLAERPRSSGRAMPCVEVEVRDAKGSRVADGCEGEIHLRSPLVMLGYWNDEVATRESLSHDRWLRTGDIGRLEDGHLYIDSRARDLILRGGENVHPIEVEQAIESHPAVDEAAVLGVDHEELGQEVLAIVVPRSADAVDVDALRDWVAARIAAFKVPVHWVVRREPLPRNATGKLLKVGLVARESPRALL